MAARNPHPHRDHPMYDTTPIQDNAAGGDGIDRRGFLKCMAWAGTGVVWTMTGGILTACTLGQDPHKGDFTFAQVSDSHIGFKQEPNTDVTATLQQAIAKVNALPQQPQFIIHT